MNRARGLSLLVLVFTASSLAMADGSPCPDDYHTYKTANGIGCYYIPANGVCSDGNTTPQVISVPSGHKKACVMDSSEDSSTCGTLSSKYQKYANMAIGNVSNAMQGDA